MRHISFDKKYTTAILIKEGALNKNSIETTYMQKCGLNAEGLIAFDLDYGGKKKPSAATRKTYLTTLLKGINHLNIKHVLCADTEYFKTLTGIQNTSSVLGYVYPCKIEGYEHINIVYTFNYNILFHKPDYIKKIQLSIDTLKAHREGTFVELGTGIIHSESYPKTIEAIRDALAQLHQYDALTCDFEAFSLKHYLSGIGTCAFAWDQHNGVAFSCDYKSLSEPVNVLSAAGRKTQKWLYGEQVFNTEVRALLKEFFETYKGKLIWHNVSYDAYIAIYQLWMDDLIDQEGLLEGLGIMTKNFECTQLITYLATNSCSGNKLSLKEQAHEFAGSWAQEDITNICLIPEPELLKYNLIDCLSTWYTYNKNYPIMVADEQEHLYRTYFKEFVVDIIQMQLTGLCLSMPKVLEAEVKLTKIKQAALDTLTNLPISQKFINDNVQEEVKTRNANYVKKVITADDALFEFNPNSNPQMQKYLYEYLGFEVIDYTKNKQPAVGNKTLDKLLELTRDKHKLAALNALIDFIKVGKLLSAFIPAFKEAPLAKDGYHYLFGSFNLGGTVSGRLSSSNPNMQNIPSGSTYAKIIKECFVAAKGWLFMGADFNALEAKVNALVTKDPAKMDVYRNNYDSHCFNTYAYWENEFPLIHKALSLVKQDDRVYKVTLPTGEIMYKHHSEIDFNTNELI